MRRTLLVLALAVLTSGRASAQDDHANARGSAATTLTIGGPTVAGRIEVAGDRDWFRFSLISGTRVTVSTSGLGAGMDTVLDVHAPSGALIGSDDDGGGGLASSFSFTATVAGTFYARIRHYASSGTGTYAVRLAGTVAPPPPPPPAPPGDDHANARGSAATLLAVGGAAVAGQIEVGGDQDWFVVPLQTGIRVTVSTTSLGAGMDTILEVVTAAGALIGRDDDGGGGLASAVTFTPAANAAYYARVVHYAASGTGTYAVRVAGAPPPDDHTDTRGPAATPIPAGGSVSGRIGAPGDNDWFQFTAQAGVSYAVTAAPTDSGMNPVVAVYSTQGTLLASDDNGGGGLTARATFVAAATGVHFARVLHAVPTAIGTYTIGVTAAAAPQRLVFAVAPTLTTAGQPLGSLRVEVRDATGLLVPTATNAITLGANVPLVAGTTTAQAVNGVATFAGLLVERAGLWSLTASSPGLTPVTSTFQVSTAPPVRMIVSTPPGAPTFGVPLPEVRVGYEDRFGNACTTQGPSVTLALAPNPAGATLQGTTDGRPALDGTAYFRGLVVDRPGQGLRLVATSSISGLTGTSGAFDIDPGAVAGLAFWQQPVGTEVGMVVSPVVRLVDAAGNYLTDAVLPVTIALAPGGGPGVLSGSLTRPTYTDAYALFRDLTLSAPGTYALVASTAGFHATSASFTIVPLAAPTGLTAIGVDGTHVVLAWALESIATVSIEVQRHDAAGGAFAPVAALPPSARGFVDATAQPDRAYVYRVVTRDAAGGAAASPTAAAATAPPAAGLVAVVRGTTRVDLSWTDASTSNAGYRLERSPGGLGQFAQLGTDLAGTATVGSDTTCEAGASYDYRVTAVGPGLSAPSAPVRVTMVTDAPAQAWAAGGAGLVVVSWAETRGADRYTVHRARSGGVVPGGPGVVAIQDVRSPLFLPGVPGQTERFVITATSTGGTSAASVEVAATPWAAGPSPAPTLHALALSLGSVRDLCVDRLRRRAYVVDGVTNELVVVDLATEVALARLPLEPGASSVSMSPNGRWLVVACAIQGTSGLRHPEAGVLCVVDPATLAIRRLAIPLDPSQVVALDAGICHVAGGSNQWTAVRAYDVETGVERSWVGAFMGSTLAMSPDQRWLYTIDTLSPRSVRAVPISPFQDRDPPPISLGFAGLDTSHGSGGALAVDASGTSGLLRSGELLTLATGGRPDVAPAHLFLDLGPDPVAAGVPGRFWGYDRVTLDLVRFDAAARTATASPGLGAAGSPNRVRLGPAGDTLLVATTDHRLVVQPLP